MTVSVNGNRQQQSSILPGGIRSVVLKGFVHENDGRLVPCISVQAKCTNVVCHVTCKVPCRIRYIRATRILMNSCNPDAASKRNRTLCANTIADPSDTPS